MIKKLTSILLVLVLLFGMIPAALAAELQSMSQVEYVSLSKSVLRMTEGDSESLTVTYEPEDAVDTNTRWSSSNPSVASVQDGTVTANSFGVATITVTVGEVSETCIVMVSSAEGNLSTTWNGDYAKKLTVNEDGAYVINTAAELARWGFEFRVSSMKTDPVRVKDVLLNADIDLNDLPWVVADVISGYTGTFDGQGHMISGLNVNTSGRGGLIATVSETGTIRNLSVCGRVSGGDQTGGIVGTCYGHIYDCLADVTVTGGRGVGGICGSGQGETLIDGCVNLGTVTGSGNSVGGILGYGDGAIIKNCYNRGDITGTGDAAGIAGGFFTAMIRNCYSTGNIKAVGSSSCYVGAISTRNVVPKNSYFLNTAVYVGISLNMNGTGKSDEELKETADALGSSWGKDTYGINDGYPILTWQMPDEESLIRLDAPALEVYASEAETNAVAVVAMPSEQDALAVIQYRMSADDSTWSDWQTEAAFYGLMPGETYYFQARYATGQPMKYLSSDPCESVVVTAEWSDIPVLDAPVLNAAHVEITENTIKLPRPESPDLNDPTVVWDEFALVQYRMAVDGIWNDWQRPIDPDEDGYTFDGLIPGKAYSFQARYIARGVKALNSPPSEEVTLKTSDGMINVNFRLIGLTLPQDKIDLESQKVSGFHGAIYRNWLSTQSYTVPANLTSTNFVGYPLGVHGLAFKLSNGWFTSVTAPQWFAGEGYNGSNALHCISGYFYGHSAGWVLLVIRDGNVIAEDNPDGSTVILEEDDTVVLCFVGDTAYELKRVPGMTGFSSPAVNYEKMKFVYDFLEIPDLNEDECREMVALEKKIDALEVNPADDSNIIALEEAYAALNDGQKESMRNYDKLLKARADYAAFNCADLNGDNLVDGKDATVLTRYLAGWQLSFADGFTGDLNRDERVDVLDLVVLRRHLAGWKGYELLPYTPSAS